jgi:hypothetical protein
LDKEDVQKDTANKRVTISYTNYRNETAERLILPRQIWFGVNEWHTEPQWLLDAIDLDRNVERTFALAMVHSWRSASTVGEVGKALNGR